MDRCAVEWGVFFSVENGAGIHFLGRTVKKKIAPSSFFYPSRGGEGAIFKPFLNIMILDDPHSIIIGSELAGM